jgi:hypothetical protein
MVASSINNNDRGLFVGTEVAGYCVGRGTMTHRYGKFCDILVGKVRAEGASESAESGL